MSDRYFQYLRAKAERDKICPPGAVPLILGAHEQHTAFVSAEHFTFLSRWKWSFLVNSCGVVYGRRKTSFEGVVKTVLLHNEILLHCLSQPRPSPKHTGDHIDHNPLNCCGWNLQWLTPRDQNLRQARHVLRPEIHDIPFD